MHADHRRSRSGAAQGFALRAVEEQLALLQRCDNAFTTRGAVLDGQDAARAQFRRSIELAAPYYWAWQICETVEATARLAPPWSLRPSDLITAHGFCWFAVPMPLAHAWAKRAAPRPNKRYGSSGRYLPAFAWGSAPDGIWLYSLYSANPVIMPTGRQFGGLLRPGRALIWRFGQTLRDAVMSIANPGLGGQLLHELDLLSACLLFLTQRIVRLDRRGDTPHRRDLDGRPRLNERTLVHTVQLRRVVRVSAAPPPEQRAAWSHRWLVSAHWRQQFYPSTGEHRPLLILPYVKGPLDRPLKPPRASVFAVVR